MSYERGLELLRCGDWQVSHRLATEESFAQPRFSRRGCRLAAIRDEREVMVWDLDDLSKPAASFSHRFVLERIALSPDGRYLVSSAANRTVQVWDMVRREPFGPPWPGLLGHFSPDGSQLLVFDTEGGVWLWDLTHVTDDTLVVPALRAEQLSASSADRRLTAEVKGEGIALDSPSGRYSLFPPALQAPLQRLGFTPDNQYLVAESADLRGWVWDLRTRTLAGPPRPLRYEALLGALGVLNLPVENRNRRALSDLAALLGMQRPDRQGGMTPVEEAERVRLLAECKRTQPNEFDVSEISQTRWHREQAVAAELAMDWDAAVFHWESALKGKAENGKQKAENRKREPANWVPETEISAEARLAYARAAAEVVKGELLQGRSRWSVVLPRPPWATAGMLDLGSFYTRTSGASQDVKQADFPLRELPRGVQVLGGTGFDVRGIICLDRTNLITIPVGRPCQRLHFLHAAGQSVALGREPVGTYQVTYASAAKAAVSLLNPEDVPPYFANFFHAASALDRTNALSVLRSTMVWSGGTPDMARRNQALFLTRTTWELPAARRGEVVSSLVLQAGPAESFLLIFAITVE